MHVRASEGGHALENMDRFSLRSKHQVTVGIEGQFDVAVTHFRLHYLDIYFV